VHQLLPGSLGHADAFVPAGGLRPNIAGFKHAFLEVRVQVGGKCRTSLDYHAVYLIKPP